MVQDWIDCRIDINFDSKLDIGVLDTIYAKIELFLTVGNIYFFIYF